ncbi:MAG: YihY family inner membrane protein [Deltaproteobacteria bacterium]|nr:YihY family inner membrane protein [Deltaproteobacteria bacterium]
MTQKTSNTSTLGQLAALLDPIALRGRARRHADAGHRYKAFLLHQAAIFVHTAKSVRDDELSRRAAALTYHTLLSIVPVLAVAFALFKAFGGLQRVEGPLRQMIVENLSVGRSGEIANWLDKFIQNINAGAIAGVGVIVLFYTAMGLLGNVEQAFNRIWGVTRVRPLYMRFAIYWAVLTLAPPLVGISLSLSARLQSSAFTVLLKEWLPFGLGRLLVTGSSMLSVSLALIFLYQLVPNTKVRFRSALLGGLVAGLLWNAVKGIFLWATAGTVKYSAIYGALGVLPLLMIWIYLSWVIVLFGVTFTVANQTINALDVDQHTKGFSQREREQLAARLLLETGLAFHRGDPPLDAEALAKLSGAPVMLARDVLSVLREKGILRETPLEQTTGYVPGRGLESLHVGHAIDALRGDDAAPTTAEDHEKDPVGFALMARLGEAHDASSQLLAQDTLAELTKALALAEEREQGPKT